MRGRPRSPGRGWRWGVDCALLWGEARLEDDGGADLGYFQCSGLKGEVRHPACGEVNRAERDELAETSGAAVGEKRTGFGRREGDALLCLGEALPEAGVDTGAVLEEPVFLGLEEVEGAGDDVGGLTVVAAVNLALDALLSFGVERNVHGGNIALVGWSSTAASACRLL